MSQQDRTNKRMLGDRIEGTAGIPGQFFVTKAGPGSTPYPADGLTPPTNVYYAEKVVNVRFARAAGAQLVEFDRTGYHDFVCNLEPKKYIENPSLILGFGMCGRWWTIDKVPGQFVTHRKYGTDGTLLWSKDHGATVHDITYDADGNVYVMGLEAADGNYVRKYSGDGALLLSIPRGTHGVFTDGSSAGIVVDSAGNILVLGSETVRKYSSTGSLVWETGGVFGGGIALATGDGFYLSGSGGAAGDLSLWNSSGAFVRYASGGHGSAGSRVSSRVSESTVMSSSSGRWNADLTTKFSTYSNSESYGIDHTGSSTWYARLGGGSVNSCSKWTVNFGFPSTFDQDWNVAQRGTGILEYDISLFDSGNSKVLVCGDRHSNITHQARDSDTGGLIWEKDHKGRVYCCAGATGSVVIGGERIAE